MLAAGLAIAGLVVARALLHLIDPDPGDALALADTVVHDALMVVAAALCVRRARRGRDNRLAWACFGAALGTYAGGEIVWSALFGGRPDPPFPSIADVLWLAFYPFAYAGLVLLVRARVRAFSPALWLDGLVGGLALAALGAALVFQPILDSTGGSDMAVAVNLAYPLGDFLLVGFVVGVFALTGWQPGRAWLFLGAGLALNGLADALYSYQASAGTFVEGGPVDQLFPVAALLLGAAALQPTVRRGSVELAGLRMLVFPTLFASIALGLLVYDHYTRIAELAFFLAVAAALAAGARAGLTFLENLTMLRRARTDSRTDSLTGLGNRRKLLEDLEIALEDGGDGTARGLALFDLNGFKRYNDHYGHPAGDAVLARLGSNLAAVIGGFGDAYRLGGDEFCVLVRLEGADLTTLVGVAAAALTEQGEGFAISSAHGSVSVPAEAAEASEALRLADQRMYAHKHGRASAAGMQSRDVLLRALQERKPELRVHLRDLADLAIAVGRRLQMEPESLDELARAAELHDVGKMALPDAILEKAGALTEEEWSFVKRHTLIGERILAAAPALRPVAALVRSSHERWDGDGYPDGLGGETIPLGSRIVAVCDAFSAMVSERPYRPARSVPEALTELHRCAGTQFDPRVVEAFCDEAATLVGEQGEVMPSRPFA